jgi:transposase
MLKMEQVHVIRHKVHIEGQSIREVAKAMHLSRTTVAKYLTMSTPVRRESRPRPAPARERVRQRIDEIVEEWRHRTTQKQRTTGTRLHRQLIEEGLAVGKTTVYECLRERHLRSAEVYIPLAHRAGDAAQVDFFEVTVETDSVRRLARLLAVIDREGEEVVSTALDRALRQSPRFQPHVPAACVAHAMRAVAVPEALRFYDVEAGRAADYDWLLAETGGAR